MLNCNSAADEILRIVIVHGIYSIKTTAPAHSTSDLPLWKEFVRFVQLFGDFQQSDVVRTERRQSTDAHNRRQGFTFTLDLQEADAVFGKRYAFVQAGWMTGDTAEEGNVILCNSVSN